MLKSKVEKFSKDRIKNIKFVFGFVYIFGDSDMGFNLGETVLKLFIKDLN